MACNHGLQGLPKGRKSSQSGRHCQRELHSHAFRPCLT
ncbi:hypothetical protein CsSME_00026411 [Camellia sinensis var. sinensis]